MVYQAHFIMMTVINDSYKCNFETTPVLCAHLHKCTGEGSRHFIIDTIGNLNRKSNATVYNDLVNAFYAWESDIAILDVWYSISDVGYDIRRWIWYQMSDIILESWKQKMAFCPIWHPIVSKLNSSIVRTELNACNTAMATLGVELLV